MYCTHNCCKGIRTSKICFEFRLFAIDSSSFSFYCLIFFYFGSSLFSMSFILDRLLIVFYFFPSPRLPTNSGTSRDFFCCVVSILVIHKNDSMKLYCIFYVYNHIVWATRKIEEKKSDREKKK